MSDFDDMKCRILKFARRYYDLFFVVVFMVVLIVPVTKFNMASYSKEENRTLAVSRKFGKNFDQWLNDRFRGRQKLIKVYHRCDRYLINRIENSKAFCGKDAWLFYKGDESVNNYQNKSQFTLEQLRKIDSNISYRRNLLDRHGIDYYVFIAPDKNRIYGENYPDYINKIRQHGRAEQLVSYINMSDRNNYICYPIRELFNEKGKGVLYYRFDTHWNDYGAFIGYQKLMKEIQSRRQDLKIIAMEDVKVGKREETGGDLMNMLQINRNSVSRNPIYTSVVSPKIAYTFQYKKNEGTKGVETVNAKPLNGLKVLFLRDSFSSAWTPYMAQTFAHVKMIWSHNFNANYHAILDFKPDIVIQEMVERYCHTLLVDTPSIKEGK